MEAEERLLEALRDQIVAGQVETLLSLEHSSASLRSEAEALKAAAGTALQDVAGLSADFATSARTAAAYLATAARDAVAAAAAAINEEANQAVARVRAETAAAEASLATAVRQAADELSDRVETSLAASAHQVDAAAASLSEQTGTVAAHIAEAQRTVVDAIVEAAHVADIARKGLAEQVARAGESVRAAGEDVSAAADASRQRLIAELTAERQEWAGVLSEGLGSAEEATARMAERVTDAGAGTSEGMAVVGERIVAALEEQGEVLAGHAAGFSGDVENLLVRWEKRDARRDSRAEDRLAALVQRIDAGWQELAAAVTAETERMATRDRTQERQRAQEFAIVLEDVLGRAGLSTRGLRGRILKVLEEDRAAEPAPTPIPEKAAEPATPTPRARRKKPVQTDEES